jgi:hypothetical protein
MECWDTVSNSDLVDVLVQAKRMEQLRASICDSLCFRSPPYAWVLL